MTAPDHLLAIQRLVATRLAESSVDDIAKSIKKDDTAACRVRSNQAGITVEQCVALLYMAGVKCVPLSHVCVERGTYEAMSHIASKAMANVDIAKQLVWGDQQ